MKMANLAVLLRCGLNMKCVLGTFVLVPLALSMVVGCASTGPYASQPGMPYACCLYERPQKPLSNVSILHIPRPATIDSKELRSRLAEAQMHQLSFTTDTRDTFALDPGDYTLTGSVLGTHFTRFGVERVQDMIARLQSGKAFLRSNTVASLVRVSPTIKGYYKFFRYADPEPKTFTFQSAHRYVFLCSLADPVSGKYLTDKEIVNYEDRALTFRWWIVDCTNPSEIDEILSSCRDPRLTLQIGALNKTAFAIIRCQ